MCEYAKTEELPPTPRLTSFQPPRETYEIIWKFKGEDLALVLFNVGVEPGSERNDDITCHEQDTFKPI